MTTPVIEAKTTSDLLRASQQLVAELGPDAKLIDPVFDAPTTVYIHVADGCPQVDQQPRDSYQQAAEDGG